MRDGVLCIDKPGGFTSFDVVAKMRGIAKTKKIGHGGTLDPMATGVLPVFLGRAAKAADVLPEQEKAYIATLRLGITTDTQDITGKVLSVLPVTVTQAGLEAALPLFLGELLQLPPMYSAVKVQGRKLYELARKGIEIERPPRPIRVHSIRLLEAREREGEYTLDIRCSKGTYIRTLCHDLGERLGCGAALSALRRTLSGGFTPEDCITLEEARALAGEGRLWERILPVERLFAGLPRVVLAPWQAKLFQNGVRLMLSRLTLPQAGGDLAVYREDGHFYGLARADLENGCLVQTKLFELEDPA